MENQQWMLVQSEAEWMEEREHLKEELEGGEIDKQVVANIQELLAALPQFSPYHLSLFHYLTCIVQQLFPSPTPQLPPTIEHSTSTQSFSLR
jgi:hypothetical protein